MPSNLNFIMTHNKLRKFSAYVLAGLLLTSGMTAGAQEKEQKKMTDAATVLSDFAGMKESIPSELIAVTEGIIVIPKMINAGFVVGAKRGKGVAMVKNADGTWSNPVFVTMTGGSIGAQIGVQSIDLVLVFKHRKSLTEIKKSSFTLGGDLSVAAGPVGRSSSANTDYKLEAEVYSYSRSKGLFAGITLNGASLDIDNQANQKYYGQTEKVKDIFEAKPSKKEEVVLLKQKLTAMQ